MAGRKRPTQREARERLQAAQEREAAALAGVEIAGAKLASAKEKLAAAVNAGQQKVHEAEQGLAQARAALAGVSGVERAAMLLDDAVVRVRADVRAVQDGRQAALVDGGQVLVDRHEAAAPLDRGSTREASAHRSSGQAGDGELP